MSSGNAGGLTAGSCPLWHRDADGWCVDEQPHLDAAERVVVAPLATDEMRQLQADAAIGSQVRAMHAAADPDRPAQRDNITTLLARLADTHPEVRALLADREEAARLRATVARVEALAKECETWAKTNNDFASHPMLDTDAHQFHAGMTQAWSAAADRIRRALERRPWLTDTPGSWARP